MSVRDGARRGILLAGGKGTRLHPLTASTSKQLIAVYNKPMIYYPLSTMLMSGISEVLVISSPESIPQYERLLGDGASLGISISYAAQPEPRGIADAFIIGSDFIGDEPSMLMLGDNIVHGRLDFLRRALATQLDAATIFGYPVSNPEDYGVIEIDGSGRPVGIEEKPTAPRSRWAIPGIYFYPPGVCALARDLRPSHRGELEITDLNRLFLEMGRLRVVPMGRGIAWFDTGTPQALLEAANFVEAVERRQGLIIGSPEEVAFRMGRIDEEGLRACIQAMPQSQYRGYLEGVLADVASGWPFGFQDEYENRIRIEKGAADDGGEPH